MRFCALSDIHGNLPILEQCDVVVICGDIVPADYRQRNNVKSEYWFKTTFLPWVKYLHCNKVVFIAGNHDFWMERMGKVEIDKIIKEAGLEDKLFYLMESSVNIDGINIFGTPYCIGPTGWAFIDIYANRYSNIVDCDVLLTHQPPYYGNIGVGLDFPERINFGSAILLNEARKHDIKYWFCGHIHSGEHREHVTYLKDDKPCVLYNVSYLNEQYHPKYSPVYIDIDKKVD